jgi:ATP adenylyltransferase
MQLFIICITLLSTNILFSSDYPPYNPRPHHIMYAPWREAYDTKVSTQEKSTTTECALCNLNSKNQQLIVYKGKKNTVVLATQPYVDKTGIHLLIVPKKHIAELQNLTPDTYKEINILTQKLCSFFSQDSYEICINTNQGKAAGASIPQHHHRHLIVMTTPPCSNLIQTMKITKEPVDLLLLAEQLRRSFSSLSSIKSPLYCEPTLHYQLCYFCHLAQDTTQDAKNLIIHRGKKTITMLSHYPTYFGEVDIIPYHHQTNLETMDAETYKEMSELTRSICPIILKLVGACDGNIGLISCSSKSQEKRHIQQRVVPRKETWITSTITGAHHLNGDVRNIYEKLLLEWNNQKAKM